jgi:hypothetical protein
MKKRILTILLASTIWSMPEAGVFSHFLSVSPVADSARLELKPVGLLSWIEIDKNWYAAPMPGTGGGLSLQLTTQKKGENYAAVSASILGIFTKEFIQGDDKGRTKFSIAFTLNTLNNVIGGGVKYNGKNWTGLICTNINLVNN